MARSLRVRLLATFAAVLVVVVLVQVLAPIAGATTAEMVSLSAVLGLVGAAVFALLLDRLISRPLEDVARTADALARGELETRARTRRTDEIGSVGRALDRMAEQLEERFADVRAEEARLRVVLDAMVEAVLVTDPSGRVVLSNAALGRLVGADPTGKSVMGAMRSAELHEAVTKAARGTPAQVSFDWEAPGRALSSDDDVASAAPRELHRIEATVSPLPARAGVIAVLHDVTELRRADAVRRDFVANASHELRTPLTSIRGYAETLRDGALDEPRIAKKFVGNIYDNAVRLSRLVDDLLELSRAESPDARVELDAVSLVPVIAKVMRSLEGRASEKGIQLVLEPPPQAELWAHAEERGLDHVLVNLVENGIKYTPSGGRVSVRLTSDDEHVTIEVADTGPGIAAHHLPRIFERFYRVDPGRSREMGGTGLGLAIVKHMVSRMDGDVSVESRVGKGSTFRVRLARIRPSLVP